MSHIEDVKLLKGIRDNLQDELLALLERLTIGHFLAYTGEVVIPAELDFIITEVMVKRYNRLDAEGLTSKSVEGLSMNFDVNDFAAYDTIFKRMYETTRNVGVKFL